MTKKELVARLIKEDKISIDEALLLLLQEEDTKLHTGTWIWHMGQWFWQQNTIATDGSTNPTQAYYTTTISNLK